MRAIRLLVVFIVVVSSFVTAIANDSNVDIELYGSKSWTISYGIGAAEGLARVGASPYQLILDQSLAVDIGGTALSVWTLDGHFNDQQPPSMQTLTVRFDTDHFKGVFGDFSIGGQQTFAVYNKRLKGVRLDYLVAGGQVTGIVSRIMGISESKTFVGRQAKHRVTFSAHPVDKPWIDNPYGRNLHGLYYHALEDPYISGISTVVLKLELQEGLQSLFTSYGIGYLEDIVAESEGRELVGGEFTVTGDTETLFLFKTSRVRLLRRMIEDYISRYNDKLDDDSLEEEYPFNVGTKYEAVFLNRLMKYASCIVDDKDYPLDEAMNNRFFYVGRQNILAGSVSVEVSISGKTYRSITEPDMSSQFSAKIYEEQGIIEVDFPEEFFAGEGNVVRIGFDYEISGNIFALGLSVIEGSEKVSLNGELLEREKDYSIDYQTGLLVMYKTVGEKDTLRVDYERLRGGLGGSAEYPRNFYGTLIELPTPEDWSLNMSLLEAADAKDNVADMTKARTMPNQHTVFGVVGSYRNEGFTSDFTLGLNRNRFPFDDNLRVNLPNEIASIVTNDGVVFVGHSSGLNVYESGEWTSYDTSDGLSGNRIYDIATVGQRVYVGTNSGLTVIDLQGDSPLAWVGNWRRYYERDGVPGSTINDIVIVDGTLWVGTDQGVGSVPLGQVSDRESWHQYIDESIEECTSVAISEDGQTVYVGTEDGLYVLDVEEESWSVFPNSEQLDVNDLLFAGGNLYLAADSGFYQVADSGSMLPLVLGEAVHSICVSGSRVYYGSETGLYLFGEDGSLTDIGVVTAVSCSSGTSIWAGSRADEDYELSVVQIAEQTTVYGNYEIGIDGRDLQRFADIPEDEHTQKGYTAQASFEQAMDGLTLFGMLETVSPGYTAIGRFARSDLSQWRIGATANVAEAMEISGSHRLRFIDQQSDESRIVMDNQVSFSWNPGPSFTASVAQDLADEDGLEEGFDEGTLSYELALVDKLFDNTVDLAVNWRDSLDGVTLGTTPRRSNQISLSGGYRPTKQLSLVGDWNRPITITGNEVSGTENGKVSVTWTPYTRIASTRLEYEVSSKRSIQVDNYAIRHEGSVECGFAGMDLGRVELRPRLSVSVEHNQGVSSINGWGRLTGTVEDFVGSVAYRGYLSGVSSWKHQLDSRLTLSLDYDDPPSFSQSLTYTLSTTSVLLKDSTDWNYEVTRRGVSKNRLAGSIESIHEKYSNSLAGSLQWESGNWGGTASARVDDQFSTKLSDWLSAWLRIGGEYEVEEESDRLGLTVDARGGADINLSRNWLAAFSVSYLSGGKAGGGLYHSLLLELSVSASFTTEPKGQN